MNLGKLAAIAAYVLWGVFPFYWRQLLHVGPLELICHRVVWSFVALMIGMMLFKSSASFRVEFFKENPWRLLWSVFAAILIAINWLVFVRSVQTNAVLESSLGYFITPLMSVGLGVFVLGERLRAIQWIAVGFAATGVAYIAICLGYVPYLALTLATSFAIYGIVKKQAPLAAIPGLWLETAVLLVPAIIYLYSLGGGSFGAVDRRTDLWIISSGPVTTLPLLLFAYGANEYRYRNSACCNTSRLRCSLSSVGWRWVNLSAAIDGSASGSSGLVCSSLASQADLAIVSSRLLSPNSSTVPNRPLRPCGLLILSFNDKPKATAPP